MSLNYVTLTCDLYDGSGNALSAGTATFTPTTQLADTTDHEIITGAPVIAAFKASGSPVVKLLATDNAAPLPSGWAWLVTFTGVPGNPAPFMFYLPYASGSAQYLSAQAPVSAAVTLPAVTYPSVIPTGVIATDLANLQAALNAGGMVRLAGVYNIGNHTLTFGVNNTVVEGSGWGTQIQWDGTGGISCFAMADTTYRRIFIRDLRITQTSGASVGTAIDASYFQDSVIERMLIDGSTNNPNISVSFNSASCFYNVLSDSRLNCDGTSAIAVRFDSGANSNVVRNCRILPSTTDSSQTGVYVNANTILLEHVDIEHAAGTGIALGALGHSCTILHPYLESNGYHVTFASGVSNPLMIGGTYLTPVTAMFQDNGAIAPSWINMRSGSSTPYSKVIFQQPSSNGQILRVINRTGSPTDVALRLETLNAGELALGAKATADGANRWEVDSAGKQQWTDGTHSPDLNLYRGASALLKTDNSLEIGTNLTVDGTASFTGSVGALSATALTVDGNALSSPQAADLGYLAWSWDPASNPGSGVVLGAPGTAGAGILNLIRIPLYGQTISATGLELYMTAIGSGLTASECFAFLYNSAGTFIAATADQSTAWTTSGNVGLLPANWASGPFNVSGLFCWAALVYNGTTGPTLLRGSSLTAAMANGKLAAAASRYGSVLSSVTTNTPGNFTPGNISQKAATIWAALY